MGVMDEAQEVHFTTVPEWRAWLVENGSRTQGVWLVQYKPRTGKPAIGYEEAVCEALCFGWIDATVRRIDDERNAQWYSPRRKGSVWARTNKARVERLDAEGRMTDAGRVVIEQAKADGSWTVLEPVEGLVVPDDLAAAFEAHAGAWKWWQSFPPTAQRAYLYWVYTAKREQTRAKRVAATAGKVARGLRQEER